MAQSLDASAGGAAVFALAAAFGSLATALRFTIVLTFASVLAFIEVNQVVEGRTRYAGNASSVGTHSEGSGQETGNRRAGHDRFGRFHCLSTFSSFGFVVVTFTTTN